MSDTAPLSPGELHNINAWRRAANYLYDNTLLREPLKIEHVKARLLGHWGR
jgi:xylulose-5-phosphate/fructose-6-phosphate phosphoketolase